MFIHRIKPRYSETDQMGIIHHSNYVVYFEEARVSYLESVGKSYADMEKNGILVVVLETYVRYIKPAYFGDELEIKVRYESLGVRFRFHYEVYRKGEKIAEGYTIHVYVDRNFKVLRPDRVEHYNLTTKSQSID